MSDVTVPVKRPTPSEHHVEADILPFPSVGEAHSASEVTSEPATQPRPAAWRIVAKDLLVLVLLTLALPITLPLVAVTWLVGTMSRLVAAGRSRVMVEPKTILISGGKMTKALQLARSFARDGHRVLLAETDKYRITGHRWSRAVHQFVTVPEPTADHYAEALRDLIIEHEVDYYVPVCSPVASVHDSEAIPLLSEHCTVIHPHPEHIHELDDKYRFAKLAEECGLRAPKSFLITDPQQVIDHDFTGERREYILKSIKYDSVRRLDLTRLPRPTREETAAFARSLPISEENPWVLQEFIPGREYCTHSTLRNGELRAHVCCESSAFQVNYEHIDEPDILSWVQTVAKHRRLTGQVSFDFLRADDDGEVYAIECNPRTHSAITAFYNHPGLSRAYLSDGSLNEPVQPLPSARPTYWIAHELHRLFKAVRSPKQFGQRLKVLFGGGDAIFDWRDPLPFFMVHHVHIPALLLRDLRQRRGWVRIDFNIGKLVQLGGD